MLDGVVFLACYIIFHYSSLFSLAWAKEMSEFSNYDAWEHKILYCPFSKQKQGDNFIKIELFCENNHNLSKMTIYSDSNHFLCEIKGAFPWTDFFKGLLIAVI